MIVIIIFFLQEEEERQQLEKRAIVYVSAVSGGFLLPPYFPSKWKEIRAEILSFSNNPLVNQTPVSARA